MRSALRPGGLLLDVRPGHEYAWVHVHRRGRALRVGQLDVSQRIPKDAVADAALQTAIAAGWFVLEREATFEFVYHFDSVDAWLACMAEQWRNGVIGTDLIARARELLSQKRGELRMPRGMHALLLRRV
jgi:hypothetical protein